MIREPRTRLPVALESLLRDLQTRPASVLRRNLVGVYLYGSLTRGAFDVRRSDVDGIVVTRRVLTPRQFRALRAWLRASAEANPWTRRLQLTFLLRSGVLRMNAEACLYQFGRLSRTTSDGNPIIWLDVLTSGVALAGPPAKSFVPRISAAKLVEALERELAYLDAEITTKPRSKWRNVWSYRVYAVLTVCRILYSFRTGAVVSKPVAARWAIGHLPARYRALVRRALGAHAGARSTRLMLSDVRRLIEVANGELQRRSRRATSRPKSSNAVQRTRRVRRPA